MHDPGTDTLSPLAVQIIKAAQYDRLVVHDEPSPAATLLEGVTPSQLLAVPVSNLAAAFAMLAGLWLLVDDLHRSHTIAQTSPKDLLRSAPLVHQTGEKRSLNTLSMESMENAKGIDPQQLHNVEASLSYWHAIMHRREGDFSNIKYWYARCANHPSLAVLAAQAPALVHGLPADKSLLRVVMNGWSAPAFVDLVEAVHQHPDDPRHRAAVELQKLEWRVLFDHCTRAAAGAQRI
jgi:hypothetical protein